MKLFRKLLAAAASAAIAITSLAFPTSAEAASRAKEIVKEMGVGWNLGNTFDSININTSDEMKYETGWGNPETTKAMIDMVAEMGFSSIRIPVSWHPHVDGNNNISSAWLNRVKTVVDWAINDGLYVIVNIHHDNDIRKGKKNYFYPSSDHLTTSKEYVTKIWKQVSEKFKNYNDHLIFETLNEPRLIGTNSEWWFNTANPGTAVNDAINCINILNQAAVDTIRATGGNNKTRLIMCPGYDASIEGATVSSFKMPNDSANMLAYSVHGYTPYEFAGDGKGTATYSRTVKNSLNWLFTSLKNNVLTKGYPVVLGEFGATDKNNYTDRANWAKDYVTQATNLGIACLVWDNGGFRAANSTNYNDHYGVVNRRTLSIPDQKYADALLSCVKKVGSLKNSEITVKYPSYTYSGKAITPDSRNGANEFTVKMNGKTLTKGLSYTVSYSSNVKVGVATATFTGKGKYEGSKSVQFVIKPAKNSITGLTTAANKITVNWKEDKTATGYQVLYSTDSSFKTYHSTTVQGKTSVNLTSVPKTGEKYYIKVRSFFTKDGKLTSTRYGNYSDVKSIVVGSAKVLGSASLAYGSYTYTGSAITPDNRSGKDDLTVKDANGKKLTKNVDYTVSYTNNKAVGVAYISIKGKGSYSGFLNKQFVIKPAVNEITSLTSTSGAFKVAWKRGTSGTVGYQVKYSTDKNFVNNVHSYTSTNLSDLSENFSSVPKSGETWYVKVRSFYTKDGSVTATRYGNYSAVKSIKVK